MMVAMFCGAKYFEDLGKWVSTTRVCFDDDSEKFDDSTYFDGEMTA